MQLKDITFLVVTYHSEKVIYDCLDLLPKESKKIIIENSNNSDLKKILEFKYPNLKCHLMNENLGYGKANNIGIRLSKTEFIFIINPDVRFKSTDLNKFLELLKHEKFVIAAPTRIEEFHENPDIKTIQDVNFVHGFAMLLNKKFLANIFFDENIFLYLEEIDLCRRVKLNKGRIIKVNVPVIHLGALSHGDQENFEMEMSRNWHWMWSKFYFKRKYNGYLFGMLSTLPSFFSSLFKFLFYSLLKNKLKKDIYKMRFSGLFNSYLLNKSFYRPNLNK